MVLFSIEWDYHYSHYDIFLFSQPNVTLLWGGSRGAAAQAVTVHSGFLLDGPLELVYMCC